MVHKQYVGRHCVIWEGHYSKTYEHIQSLVKVATNDFPGLYDNDIEVVVFNSTYKKGVTGIMFHITDKMEIPDDYEGISAFDYIY